MKIWCVSKYGSPEAYGPSTKLFNTAKGLSKDHSVTLISSNANPKATYPLSKKRINVEYFEELRHVWINLPTYKKSRSLSRFISWLLFDFFLSKVSSRIDEIPDVIIISSLPITSIRWALKMKKTYGLKVIFEVRDIYPLTMLEMGYSKYNPLVMFIAYLEKIGYENSDLIIGTMSQLTLHVEKTLGYKKETFFSPIGLSPLFRYDNEVLDLELPANKTIVGYVGSLGKANNLDPLIELVKMNKNNENVHFLFVGDGEYLNSFKSLDVNNITLTGFIQPKNVYKALNAIDILLLSVNPSKVFEYGQSLNKLKEYLATGKIIVANYHGYKEDFLVSEGILYSARNDADSLNQTLQKALAISKDKMKILGESNKQIVHEHYNYDSINYYYLTKINELFNLKFPD